MGEEEFGLGGNPAGFFLNQTKTPLEYYIDSIYDDESEFQFNVQYVCACGLPVFRSLSDEYGFGCDHCDSICTKENCVNCKVLNSVDFGDPNAGI